MKIEITIRHRAEDLARAKLEMNGMLDELGQLCALAEWHLIEDPSVGSYQDWLSGTKG